MGLEEDIQLALEAKSREAKERYRLHRVSRFLGAYEVTTTGFTFAQAAELERRGADYHLAEQLAHPATGPPCPPELAMKILL
jgi:hypothetical protein